MASVSLFPLGSGGSSAGGSGSRRRRSRPALVPVSPELAALLREISARAGVPVPSSLLRCSPGGDPVSPDAIERLRRLWGL